MSFSKECSKQMVTVCQPGYHSPGYGYSKGTIYLFLFLFYFIVKQFKKNDSVAVHIDVVEYEVNGIYLFIEEKYFCCVH